MCLFLTPFSAMTALMGEMTEWFGHSPLAVIHQLPSSTNIETEFLCRGRFVPSDCGLYNSSTGNVGGQSDMQSCHHMMYGDAYSSFATIHPHSHIFFCSVSLAILIALCLILSSITAQFRASSAQSSPACHPTYRARHGPTQLHHVKAAKSHLSLIESRLS